VGKLRVHLIFLRSNLLKLSHLHFKLPVTQPAMPAPFIDDEEPYASSEDSDFAPDTENGPAAEDSDQSASESEAGVTTKQQSAKRNAPSGQGTPAEDAGYDNSGDEAIIKKGERKRRKGKSKDDIEDEDGGEGGLIKTRRQRAAEYVTFPMPSDPCDYMLMEWIIGRKGAG
jgi:hypothetical protein